MANALNCLLSEQLEKNKGTQRRDLPKVIRKKHVL
jgi:hypothetical protein